MWHALLSGLPGAMAAETAALLIETGEFGLIDQALSSDRHSGSRFECAGRAFTLRGPAARDSLVGMLPACTAVIDFSTPGAMADNARWLCSHGLPFVMGTTGGDIGGAEAAVRNSDVCAVIAPNMAAPIVLLQAMFGWAAREFPGALRGHRVQITESHQASKRDTSGTAKAMVRHLSALGLPASVEAIRRVRDPASQVACLGVPEAHLRGHAFHRYEVDSADGTVHLELRHEVCGRRVYAEGAIAALRFLVRRVERGERGRCFSMEDVLRG